MEGISSMLDKTDFFDWKTSQPRAADAKARSIK